MKKDGKTTINYFTLTEEQRGYYTSQLKSGGPSFANAFVRITAYDYFAGDDKDQLVRESCETH